MSPLQVAQEMKALLAARAWTGGAAKVFASVHITAHGQQLAISNFRLPMALVQVGSSSSDPEEPGFLTQKFVIIVVAAVAGDEVGENVITGAHRASATASEGAGLGQVEVELKAAIRDLGPAAGLTLQLVSESDMGAGEIPEIPYSAYRSYTFSAFCVTDAA